MPFSNTEEQYGTTCSRLYFFCRSWCTITYKAMENCDHRDLFSFHGCNGRLHKIKCVNPKYMSVYILTEVSIMILKSQWWNTQLCEPDSHSRSSTMQLSLNILPTSIFNMDISKNITELQHIGISNWNVNKSKYYC